MSLDTWNGEERDPNKLSARDHEIKAYVEAFARNETPERFMVLMGEKGTGKTHLSVSAVKIAHSAWIVARIAYVVRMFDEMQGAIENRSTDEVFRFYADTPLLAIDDRGLENATAWKAERWDYLINERYTIGNKTIIATNQTVEQIPPRIADRIFDAKYGKRIELHGESARSLAER